MQTNIMSNFISSESNLPPLPSEENVRFISATWTKFNKVNDKYVFAGYEKGRGLQVYDKLYLTDGTYKSLCSKYIRITGVHNGIPSWASSDLIGRYNDLLGTRADTSKLDSTFAFDFEKNPRHSSDISLSEEQELFVREALSGHNILVDACIGSGKTTAIQHLCNYLPSIKKVLYLTYNRLLKIDAKEKIKMRNVTVTNYHGFAFSCLKKMNVNVGISDMIQSFIKISPEIPHYDMLIIDEYQDIEQELSIMLTMIKESNPGIQIVAVGDMQQKIYDKTTLDVERFINGFLDEHKKLEFTRCFRLSSDHAALLGRVWHKKIAGVNKNCKISTMSEADVLEFLAKQNPKDILCLGARTGSLSATLNDLEELYPDKYNKFTVYASIFDNDSLGKSNPDSESAIFTTYDSSKGLERKICVLFDFTDSYWTSRIRKPQQSYEILRNIFCVAASRGKEQIIFVEDDEDILDEDILATPIEKNLSFQNVNISDMFDFKYKEDVEDCFSLLKTKKIDNKECSIIDIKGNDGLIDVSPCIGIYQEASFFTNYDIDNGISFKLSVDKDKEYLYTDEVRNAELEKKILFSVAIDTKQNRYFNQVTVPFISREESLAIHKRLKTVFSYDEQVQEECSISFANENGEKILTAKGQCDVLKDKNVYELKFVSELTHEHFLQCACYIVAMNLKKGYLWNTRDNSMYEIKVPNKKKFLDAVIRTITKGAYDRYFQPQ